jgi:THAP4-like, heme-binding beta-barrel domain
MESESTHQLALTRLWYLVGNWEGTGKGPDFRFRATATYSWALDDHFIASRTEIRDAGSGQVLSLEQGYLYYDRARNSLVADVFCLDGTVEHALGHADARGRMVLTADSLRCLPPDSTVCRMRRTTWMMVASQWAFTVEVDSGQGFVPYLEGQMRRA